MKHGYQRMPTQHMPSPPPGYRTMGSPPPQQFAGSGSGSPRVVLAQVPPPPPYPGPTQVYHPQQQPGHGYY